jgi:hypothetical protein
MQYPPPPQDKSPHDPKEARASLALRLNRAANDLNPILIVFAVGLLVLNLTLYLGMAASRQPFIWMTPRQLGSRIAPATTSSSSFNRGASVSAAGN